jgi:crotonobetainyl-CoA:carnitine CoA-transferase CaiB-like acyl-CoA transferase
VNDPRSRTAPLDGVRVIDFSRVLAGPHCVKILRELGAEVIKIEPPSADLARLAVPASNGVSHYFAQQNAGKRNVSIDLNYPAGRAVVLDLCRRADVIVENFRPGTLATFGLDYASVAAINAEVVYVSISGYGQTGPWKSRAGYAPTVHAESGFTDALLGHLHLDGDGARNDYSSHADVYTGMEAAIAVLAGLHERQRTGAGQHIDVAMAATLLAVNERLHSVLSDIDRDGEPDALSAADSPIFHMPDGSRITIVCSPVYTPIFHRYCAMMNRPDLLTDPRFTSARARAENEAALLAEVRAWLLTFTDFQELEAQVKVGGLAVGRLRTTREFAATEWATERRAIVDIDDGAGGAIKVAAPPWRFSRSELHPPTTVAHRGADNFAVLTELGLSEQEIKQLEADGVLSHDKG